MDADSDDGSLIDEANRLYNSAHGERRLELANAVNRFVTARLLFEASGVWAAKVDECRQELVKLLESVHANSAD